MANVENIQKSTALGDFARALRHAGASAVSCVALSVRPAQTARMCSVLSRMSDEQLRDIGITRQEIPAYAAKLTSAE